MIGKYLLLEQVTVMMEARMVDGGAAAVEVVYNSSGD